MDTDRSGRTLKADRDLFWKAEKRIKDLEAEAEQEHLRTGKEMCDLQSALNYSIKDRQQMEARLDAVKALQRTQHCYVWYDELMEAIGEQNETK